MIYLYHGTDREFDVPIPERGRSGTDFETLAPYRMKVVFNDGETRVFDGRKLLQGEAFAPLSDADVFANCKLDYETLTWLDGELDVAPEFVYENSETYSCL